MDSDIESTEEEKRQPLVQVHCNCLESLQQEVAFHFISKQCQPSSKTWLGIRLEVNTKASAGLDL